VNAKAIQGRTKLERVRLASRRLKRLKTTPTGPQKKAEMNPMMAKMVV